MVAPRSVDAATPDGPRRGFRQPDVRTRIGRNHPGHLPANARLRARLVHLRRRYGRARRWLLACGTFAFGDFELLIGKFYGYSLD